MREEVGEIFFVVHEEVFDEDGQAEGVAEDVEVFLSIIPYTPYLIPRDTKIRSKYEKTATEALLLRFRRGVTGNRTRDTRIFSPLLYQLSYDTSFVLKNYPSFRLGLQR